MPTKKEQEEIIKSLKEKLKEVTSAWKEALDSKKGELGENPYTAIGLYKDDTGYKIARIAFNPENGSSEVISQTDASRVPEAYHLATHNLDKIITEEILPRLEKYNA